METLKQLYNESDKLQMKLREIFEEISINLNKKKSLERELGVESSLNYDPRK